MGVQGLVGTPISQARTAVRFAHVSEGTYIYGKNKLLLYIYMAKETYGDKREPTQTHQTLTIEAKETYYRSKRNLPQRQKRPNTDATETYY